MLEVNQKAPNFKLFDQNNVEHTLEEYLHQGKKVLIYFYPKDNTPGCTQEACGYNALLKDFMDKNTVVIGISKDSITSHKKFETNYSLKFTLLADPNLEAIQSYDVYKEKKQYGRTFMGVVRTTYLLDENGTIIFANDKVKAKDDPLKMLGII